MNNTHLIEKLTRIKLLADECLRDIAVSRHRHLVPSAAIDTTTSRMEEGDFKLPLRPFLRKYASGIGGPKQFTLLVAYLVGGDLNKEAALIEIEKAWNRATALLGSKKFNRFFAQEAKDNDWVITAKRGVYSLRPRWKEILENV